MQTTNSRRHSMKLTKLFSLGFAALFTLAQIAKSGPPLICHALNIGGAKSLPWSNDVWSLSGKTDYDLSRLVADTLELLAPSTPRRPSPARRETRSSRRTLLLTSAATKATRSALCSAKSQPQRISGATVGDWTRDELVPLQSLATMGFQERALGASAPEREKSRHGEKERAALTGITSLLLERQRGDARPEPHGGLHHQDKALQVQRFGDETVGVKVVDFIDVLFGVRARDDHHRDAAQLRVLLDFRQDFAAVLAGQA